MLRAANQRTDHLVDRLFDSWPRKILAIGVLLAALATVVAECTGGRKPGDSTELPLPTEPEQGETTLGDTGDPDSVPEAYTGPIGGTAPSAALDRAEAAQAVTVGMTPLETSTHLRAEIGADSDNPYLYIYLGNALYAQGQFFEFEQAYRDAMRLDPENDWIAMKLAMNLHAVGNTTTQRPAYPDVSVAQEVFEEAWLEFPGSEPLGTRYGYFLATAINDDRAALAILQETVDANPDSAIAWRYLGWWGHDELQDAEATVLALDEAIRLDPSDGLAWGYLLARRDYDTTEEMVTELSTMASIEGLRRSAFAARFGSFGVAELGKAEAEAALAELRRRNPGSAIALLLSSYTHSQLGDSQLAVAELRDAIALGVGDPDAYERLLRETEATAGVEEAIDVANELVRSNPGAFESWQVKLERVRLEVLAIGGIGPALDLSAYASSPTDRNRMWRTIGNLTELPPEAREQAYRLAIDALPDYLAYANLTSWLVGAGRADEAQQFAFASFDAASPWTRSSAATLVTDTLLRTSPPAVDAAVEFIQRPDTDFASEELLHVARDLNRIDESDAALLVLRLDDGRTAVQTEQGRLFREEEATTLALLGQESGARSIRNDLLAEFAELSAESPLDYELRLNYGEMAALTSDFDLAIDVFTDLLHNWELERSHRRYALEYRAWTYRVRGDDGLADADDAAAAQLAE